MFQNNTKIAYTNAINLLRGTAGTNPEHNRHIQQIAQCIQDAISANNFEYDMTLFEMRQMINRQQKEIDELKATFQAQSKQTPPATPIPADIFISPSSLKKAKKDIIRYLN